MSKRIKAIYRLKVWSSNDDQPIVLPFCDQHEMFQASLTLENEGYRTERQEFGSTLFRSAGEAVEAVRFWRQP